RRVGAGHATIGKRAGREARTARRARLTEACDAALATRANVAAAPTVVVVAMEIGAGRAATVGTAEGLANWAAAQSTSSRRTGLSRRADTSAAAAIVEIAREVRAVGACVCRAGRVPGGAGRRAAPLAAHLTLWTSISAEAAIRVVVVGVDARR